MLAAVVNSSSLSREVAALQHRATARQSTMRPAYVFCVPWVVCAVSAACGVDGHSAVGLVQVCRRAGKERSIDKVYLCASTHACITQHV